jgi:triphosphatase
MNQPEGIVTNNGAPDLETPALLETAEEVTSQDGKDAQPKKADSRLSGSTSMVEAGRNYIASQVKKFREAEPTARAGKDREGVHDMRVATRRVRENLRLLGETCFNPAETDALRKKLQRLARTLGETRDTDVFLEHLDTYDAQLPVDQRAGLEPLRQLLKKRYKRSHKTLLKLLDDPKTQKLIDRLDRFTADTNPGVTAKKLNKDAVAPSLVRHFAGSTIWKRYEEVLAYDTIVNSETSQETLHQLRIAFKRLRYTIEFFDDALPPTIKTLHQQLVKAQDDLGALHDDYAANIYLTGNVLNNKKPDKALGKYRESREVDSLKVKEGFLQKWRLLSGLEYKRQLASAITGLTAR